MDSTMLSLGHAFFPNADLLQPTSDENAAQYWQRFERTWQWRKQQFDRGLVEVTVSDTEPTADSRVPFSYRPMTTDYAARVSPT